MSKKQKSSEKKNKTKRKQEKQEGKVSSANHQSFHIKKFSPILGWLLKVIMNFWAFIVFSSVILSIYVFYPKIDVSVGQSIDYSDPFKTPFIINNHGYFPIYNVKYYLITTEAKMRGGAIISNNFNELTMFPNTSFIANKIEPDKGISVFVQEARILDSKEYKAVEIYMMVSYQILPNFIRLNEWYRFMTSITYDVQYFWFEQEIIDSVVENLEKQISN